MKEIIKKSYCDYFCDDKGDQRQRRDWYYSVDIKKKKDIEELARCWH